MEKIKVLVCDDHEIFIDGISKGLEEEQDIHAILF